MWGREWEETWTFIVPEPSQAHHIGGRRGHVTPGLDGLTWGYFGADWGGAGSLAQLLLGLTKSASR